VPEQVPAAEVAVVVVAADEVVEVEVVTLAVVVVTLEVVVVPVEPETDETGGSEPVLEDDQKPMVDWKPSLFWDWLIRPVPPRESW